MNSTQSRGMFFDLYEQMFSVFLAIKNNEIKWMTQPNFLLKSKAAFKKIEKAAFQWNLLLSKVGDATLLDPKPLLLKEKIK